MKILVANIGSTSFKFRLFQMDGGLEREIASGGADRIGGVGGQLSLKAGGKEVSHKRDFADQGAAIAFVLDSLAEAGALADRSELGAVAFKAVMAGDAPPVSLVDDEFLAAMEYYVPVAPGHNPAYIAAMRMFRLTLGGVPLVAAMETGFHQDVPDRRRMYAVPPAWAQKYGVKRYGFHGASHRYIATTMAKLMPAARRIISCHLGGSSSLCAIRDGKSTAVSMGLSPQSGLPQSNRAGDFDPFAFALLAGKAGLDAKAFLDILGGKSGLAALSNTSGDMRDIEDAAVAGDDAAKLALDVYVTAIRDYLGSYLVELGGAEAIVFTGGIGQKSPIVRKAVCEGLAFAGIELDAAKNETTKSDARIESAASKAAIWVLATNEELIVARQAVELLSATRA